MWRSTICTIQRLSTHNSCSELCSNNTTHLQLFLSQAVQMVLLKEMKVAEPRFLPHLVHSFLNTYVLKCDGNTSLLPPTVVTWYTNCTYGDKIFKNALPWSSVTSCVLTKGNRFPPPGCNVSHSYFQIIYKTILYSQHPKLRCNEVEEIYLLSQHLVISNLQGSVR